MLDSYPSCNQTVARSGLGLGLHAAAPETVRSHRFQDRQHVVLKHCIGTSSFRLILGQDELNVMCEGAL